jgi:hypothetical protein
MLVREGMRTVQVIGVPSGPAPGADAVVVALKSRTVPAARGGGRVAGRAALAAGRWRAPDLLQVLLDLRLHARPATSARWPRRCWQALGAPLAIACPAFPENGRTVFRGHLFVGDQLLSDSGMRDHPLTPMTDSNLVRVLQAQSTGPRGPAALRRAGDGRRGRARPAGGAGRRRRGAGGGRRRRQRRPACAGRSGGRCAAGHRRIGRGAGPAGCLCAARLAATRRAGGDRARRGRHGRGAVGLVLGGHQRARCSTGVQRPSGDAHRPAALAAGVAGGAAGAGLGRAADWRQGRCWSTPPPSRPR